MIPFDKLELKVSENSFVGIKKENNNYIFYLPLGFDTFICSKPSKLEIKNLFFQFFQLIYKENNKTKNRDGEEKDTGTGGEEKEHPIFYENLNIGNLIKTYDDTKIQAINTFKSMEEVVDFSNINYDEVYYTQKNELIMLETVQPKNKIKYSPIDIIRMYGFIYEDIFNQLNKDIFSEIKFLANDFREKFGITGSLFDDEKLIEEFKDILEEIDSNITIKPPEYFEFYEKIYKFLYYSPNKDGIVAGIDNFHSIWEKLCLNYIFKYWEKEVLFADYKEKANCKLNGYQRMYCKETISEENYPFKITYGEEKKYIYPDLIMLYKPIFYYYGYFYAQDPGIWVPFSGDDKFEEIKKNINTILKEKKLKECYIMFSSKENSCRNYRTFQLANFSSQNNYKRKGDIQIKCKDKYLTNLEIFVYLIEKENIDHIILRIKDSEDFKNLFIDLPECKYNNIEDLTATCKNKLKTKLLNQIKEKKIKESIVEKLSNYFYNINLLNFFLFFNSKIDLNDENSLNSNTLQKRVIDIKYKTKEKITNTDKVKNMFYELCLDNVIENVVVLPIYINNKILELIDNNKDEKIKIVYWNIKVLLEEYIND